MNAKRKITALLLCAAMLLSLSCPLAYAETTSGNFGDGLRLHWAYDGDTLTITGNGPMPDFSNSNPPPWQEYKLDITTITIGEGVTSIGDSAFQEYPNLIAAQLPNGLISIGADAFEQASLREINLPDSITSIGAGAFWGCNRLSLNNLPANLTSIGEFAFFNCTSLALTELPNGMRSIGQGVFFGCTSLALTELPDNITSIAGYAFQDCTHLALTEIPSCVTSIGPCAFQGCTGLTELTFTSNPAPELSDSVFEGCGDGLKIHIPAEATGYGEDGWPTENITYHVTIHNAEGGTATASPEKAKEGATITLTVQSEQGYHFNGWQVTPSRTEISDNSFTMPADNVIIQPIFEENKLKKPGSPQWDGTVPEKAVWQAVEHASGYSVRLYKGTAPVGGEVSVSGTEHTFSITEPGSYTFKVKAKGEAPYVESEEAESGALHTVSFETDGAGTVPMQLVKDGNKSAAPATLTRDGYTFGGWYTDAACTAAWDFENAVSETMTLYAKWTEDKPAAYTIAVQAGDGGAASASRTSAEAGETITLTAAPDTGYHFKEWQIVSGNVTITNNCFTMPAENVTVKAVFEKDTGSSGGEPGSNDPGSSGGNSGGSSGSVTPTPIAPQPTPEIPPEQNPWQQTQLSSGNSGTAWKYVESNGTPLTGGHWLAEDDKTWNLYLFDGAGFLLTGGQASAAAPDGSGIRISAAGDVWMNGHRYYLNPERDLNAPQSCYAMTNYSRVLANNGGISYHDKNGITYRGWLRGADGSMRYQTYIQPEGGEGYCLIVWRVQYIPESPDPDYPNDPTHNIPAGWYFFDDNGIRVTAAGWYDGKDGREYYANADGRVTDSRKKI